MGRVSRLLVPALALAAGLGVVSLHAGCSGSSKPAETTSVRGRVTFQGQPVAGAMVVFSPDRDRGASGKPLPCECASDGLFELKFEGNPAVPPGWYRVAIAPPANDPAAGADTALFPRLLRRPDTSKLGREIVPGKEHFFEFAVEVNR